MIDEPRTQPGSVGHASPLYLSSYGGRNMFAWHHAPHSKAADTAILFCNSIGYESVCLYRGLRYLATRAAELGYHSLRFDYSGTGDSSGNLHDPGLLESWIDDVVTAARALLSRSKCTKVHLVGVRFGSLLALEAASRIKETGDVTLIAGARGRTLVRELKSASKLQAAVSEHLPEGSVEAFGFLFLPELLEGLSSLGDTSKVALNQVSAIRVVERDDAVVDERFARDISARHPNTLIARPAGYGAWMQDPHKTEVQTDLENAVLGSLSVQAPSSVSLPSGALENASSASMEAAGIHENARFIDAEHHIFGVFSRGPQRNSRPLVVFLNAGAVHHIGPNRLYVRVARELAQRGVESVRLDLPPLGDSGDVRAQVAPMLYSRKAVGAACASIEALRENFSRPLSLVGLCAGGYVAFHVAEAMSIERVVLINPQTFEFREGDSLDVPTTRAVYRDTHHLFQSAKNIGKWRKLFRGEANLRKAIATLAQRTWLEGRTRARELATRVGILPMSRLEQRITTILEKDTSVHFVFSEGDPGLGYINETLGGRLPYLLRHPRITLDCIPDADHTFTPTASQDVLEHLLLDRLS